MEDILFDSQGRLLGVGESTRQHQQDILVHNKGWNKFSPEVGVGILDYLSSDGDLEALRSAVSHEMERDGMRINEVILEEEGKITVDAEY